MRITGRRQNGFSYADKRHRKGERIDLFIQNMIILNMNSGIEIRGLSCSGESYRKGGLKCFSYPEKNYKKGDRMGSVKQIRIIRK
jgi:hypothetical protein